MEQLRVLFPQAEPQYLKYLSQQYKKMDHITITKITEKLVTFGYPLKQSPNGLLLSVLEVYVDMDLKYARDLVLKHKSLFRILQLVRDYPKRRISIISERDMFRDPEYITACRIQLLNEFPFHWESTIDQVMAEQNCDYLKSKKEIQAIKPSYLWKTILPFTRRREMKNRNHPQLMHEMMGDDELIAIEFVRSDYEKQNQLIQCQCCFSECIFEELNQCNVGHLFCKECITQQVMIGMYDTGSIRGKIVNCMSSETECKGEILDCVLQVVLPKDLYQNYQATLFEKAVQEANVNITQCPFCNYFEESAGQIRFLWIYDVFDYLAARIEAIFTGFYLFLFVFIAILSNSPLESVYFLSLVFYGLKSVWEHHQMDITLYFKRSRLNRYFKRPNPLVLNCKNTNCLKISCTACQQQWKAGHRCFEKEKDSLRVCVEMAMSQALIRTCPSCNIRFSKVDGCNKMECPYCKYVMCYICRQDIRKQKYKHFCQHFRIIPGTKCDKCDLCDLYQIEADQVTVRKAAMEAEKEWRLRNPGSLHVKND